IQSVLTILKVGNFRINKGVFALNNSPQKTAIPLLIKKIDFYIKGLIIDSSSISQKPNSYSEDIQLKIGGQTIQFPEGRKSIQFSSFKFNISTGNLDADSCSISSNDEDSAKATFNLFAEKMRIRNIYLATNDSVDFNRIDSLFFTRPKVSFSIKIDDKKKDSSETISIALKRITSAAFGKILVRYVSINNVDFDIDVERKDKISTFNFVQDRLEVTNLGLGLFPTMPISADNIRFGLKEFVDYFRDSTYLVHFDSVRINNDRFSLFNFKMESTARVRKGEQIIYIPILQMRGIDWLQLLTQKRLVASNFTLNDPFISIVAAGNGKTNIQKKNDNLDSLLRQMFLLENITISNGSINYAFPGNGYIHANNINSDLGPVEIAVPGSLASIQKMIHQFRTGEFIYFKDGWRMIARDIVYTNGNSFRSVSIDLSNGIQNLRIKANNVTVSGFEGDLKSRSFDIGKLHWDNANILVDLSRAKSNNIKPDFFLSLGAVNGGSTDLKLLDNGSQFNVKFSKLKTAGIVWGDGRLQQINELFADGTSMDFDAGTSNLHAGKFLLQEGQPSYINSLTSNFSMNKKSVKISIPAINLEASIQQAIQNRYTVHWLKIFKPEIEVNLDTSISENINKEEKPFPELDLGKIEITDPVISFQQNYKKNPLQIQYGNTSLSADELKSFNNGAGISVKNIQFSSENFTIDDKDSLHIHSSNGRVSAGLDSFKLYSKSPGVAGKWELSNGSLDLSNINLLHKGKSGLTDSFQLTSLHLGNFSLDERSYKDPGLFFASKPLAAISNTDFIYKNEKTWLRVKGMKASSRTISMDSFFIHPQLDINSFMETQPYQKDYITAVAGPVYLNDIDAGAWLKDSIIKIGHIKITRAELTASRDKNLPFQADVVKALPVNLVKKIPLKTSVDSIGISNAKIVYNEVSEKTQQTGTIQFNRLTASIQNIKNYDLTSGDSLQMLASAYVMDTALLQVKLKESYKDSLASFPIIVRAEPFNLQFLNSFLLPTVSVKIKSGFSSFLQMKAVATEHLAVGEIRFLYRNLKVEFLKGGNDQKKTLLTSLKTFAANSFVIKKNNSRRVGKVYYERSRNRSFFNYLVRMIASGGASSVGAKRNKKDLRIYKSKIREVHLPEVDF
ncbi:MAG: hypothetical protein ABI581_14385, partial [Sediminibacterium sp.]